MKIPFHLRLRGYLSACILHIPSLLVLLSLCVVNAATAARQIPADAVPVEVTGKLNVFHIDDFEHGKGQYLSYLEDASKKTKFTLHFEGDMPPGLQSGATVRIKGFAKEKELYLAADGTTPTMQVIAPAAVMVSGDQKTLVMVANFADKSLTSTVTAIQDLMFTSSTNQSIDDLYRETSSGQLSFSGNVIGPFNLNAQSTDACDFSAWADAADAKAKAANINLSQYTRKVYVMPQNSCPAAGIGDLGGSPSRAWIFHSDIADVYGHELGHNLGMHHAATPSGEYGDNTDIMGLSQNKLRQINAAHKEQLGWLVNGQAQPLTQSGFYDLVPLELDTASLASSDSQGFKIVKSDTNEFYYVSYRRKLGFDTNLSLSYTDRISVHRYKGDGSSSKTYLLAMLADGQSYVDSTNDITIQQVSHANDRATVQVQFGTATCQTGAPSIAVTPSSQSGTAGTTLNYSISITNADLSSCPQSTFNLAALLPSGWTGSVSPTSVTLVPGGTASASLAVTAPATATDGAYGLQVSATDPNKTGHSNMASASYTISMPCARSAPTIAVNPSLQSAAGGTKLNYGVSVTNNDSSNCGATTLSLPSVLPSGWSGSVSPSTLTLNPGQMASSTLSVASPTSALAGAYTVGVSSVDSLVAVHAASGKGTYSVLSTDTQAPSIPMRLSASAKRSQVKLTWQASSDNVGVAGYDIWRNGTRIASSTGTSYTDNVPTAGSYSYAVAAFDQARQPLEPFCQRDSQNPLIQAVLT